MEENSPLILGAAWFFVYYGNINKVQLNKQTGGTQNRPSNKIKNHSGDVCPGSDRYKVPSRPKGSLPGSDVGTKGVTPPPTLRLPDRSDDLTINVNPEYQDHLPSTPGKTEKGTRTGV